jgi:hypothetical protein
MWEDPIVEEIHQTRKKLAAEFNFDIEAIFADLQKRQTALGERLVPQMKSIEQIAEGGKGRISGSTTPTSTPTDPAA